MRLIAIAGGKGGVGKSLIASSLGIYLAQVGKRVLLVDGDPHAFVLGPFLGMDEPPLGSAPTDVAGLFVTSTAGLESPSAVFEVVRAWDGDVALLDLPPSHARRARDLWRAAQVCVLCVTPDPPAVAGAFRLLRAVLDDAPGETLVPALVVNQARGRPDQDLGANLRTTAGGLLGVRVEPYGTIDADETVRAVVRKGRPVMVDHPETQAARDVERVARRLLGAMSEPTRHAQPSRRLAAFTHYEALEVERGSTEEEVRRAYRRMREIYGPGSLAVAGLADAHVLEAALGRIERAYEVLLDADQRRDYDREIFPEGRRPDAPLDVESADARPGAAPDEPPVDGATRFTGELLRRIRAARGIDLEEISDRTRVGVGYLDAIEQERYDELPPRVYVRGFLVDYARCLRLDPAQVARTYLARMDEQGSQATRTT